MAMEKLKSFLEEQAKENISEAVKAMKSDVRTETRILNMQFAIGQYYGILEIIDKLEDYDLLSKVFEENKLDSNMVMKEIDRLAYYR